VGLGGSGEKNCGPPGVPGRPKLAGSRECVCGHVKAGEEREDSPSSEAGSEQVVICIDHVSEQISTDIGKKDEQNLSDAGSSDVLSGGIAFKGFSVTALVLGLFLGSFPDFRVIKKTLTGVMSFIVVTQPLGEDRVCGSRCAT